ncbi:MAG: heme exporter protein CcmB [Myxococcales bacterium]|nr:heme exporter protein CcmB [Myxococcales bacterium]
MTALRLTWLLLKKDLRIAARSREMLGFTLLFAVLCVLVFAFGFLQEGTAAEGYVPGVLWVTLLFSSSVSLLRLFAAEEEGGTLELVSATSAGTVPLFVSKVLVQLLFTGLVTVVVLPMVLLFFNAELRGIGPIAASLLLGLIGQATVGTLCSALLVHVRLREVLLPLVLYPTVAPLLIGGVKVTALALAGAEGTRDWLTLMLVFDLLFVVASPWLHGRALAR